MKDDLVIRINPTKVENLSSYLSGIAFTVDSAIIGGEGLSSYVESCGVPEPSEFIDGRFFAIIERDEYFSIFTDPMGQETLYYYAENPISIDGVGSSRWVLSNSLLSMVEEVRRFEGPSLHMPSLLTYFISGGNGIGAQLLSNNTPIEKVKVLPIGCEFRISKLDNSASIKRVRSGDWLLDNEGLSYREWIEDYLTQSLSRISAIVEAGRFDLFCDISGGHDSRAVLGMLLRSCGDRERVTFLSDRNKTDDRQIADLLGGYFGISVGDKAGILSSMPARESFDLWKHSSVGVYLPIVVPSNSLGEKRMRFHGGNFLSKEFGEIPALEKAKSFQKWVHSPEQLVAVKDEFFSSFVQMGIDMESDFAMHLHYINFRSRFHYGRHWHTIAKVPTMTPLISPGLAKAAFQLPVDQYNKNRVSLDLLLAIDNALGVMPFDKEEKRFPIEFIENSPFWGKPMEINSSSLPKTRVFSSASAVRGGENESQESAGQAGFRDVFRESYAEYEQAGVETGIFTQDYLRRARKEVDETKFLARDARAAAHVLHAGILRREIS